MTPNGMVEMVRRFIADEKATGYVNNSGGVNMEEPEGTEELLTYLDRAVEEYSLRQAVKGDVRLLKTMSISLGSTVPSDYLMMCGSVPVNIVSGIIMYYGDETVMPVRYFARLPYVSSYSLKSTLPYKRDQEISICALAAIYALNKHEFNVSQDLMLLGYGGGAANANTQ